MSRLIISSPAGLRWVYLCLLLIFISFAYQSSVGSPFIFDDLPNIVLNSALQPSTLAELPLAIERTVGLSYRPVAGLTFAINYLLGELDVYGYHLVNIMIHGINALLLYQVLILLLQAAGRMDSEACQREGIRLAFWATILWALNPVQVHSVTYIVQRMTSLSSLFYLLGLCVFLWYRAGRLQAGIAGLLLCLVFSLGILSKEIMITLPVALILLDQLLPASDRSLSRKLLFSVLLLVSIVAMYYLRGVSIDLTTTYPGRGFNGLERLMTEARILWHYLSIWFMPLPGRLQLDYEVLVSRGLWQPVTTLFSIVSLLLVTGVAWRVRSTMPFLSLAWLFFLLASSLEASFLNLELAFIHRLYLPSVFLIFGVLSVLPTGGIKKYALLLWVLVALLTTATLQRNQEWSNRAQFWNVDYQRGASPARSILNHSIGLIETNRPAEAIPLLEKIVPVSQGQELGLILLGLGTARFHTGDYTGAIEQFDRLETAFVPLQESLYYKGSAYARLGQLEQLKTISDELLEVNKKGVYGYLLRAEYQRRTGNIEQALSTVTQYMQNERLSLEVMNNCRLFLADIYLELQQPDRAYELYNTIIAKDPHQFLAWIQIYRMLKSSGDSQNLAKVQAYLQSKQVRLPDE